MRIYFSILFLSALILTGCNHSSQTILPGKTDDGRVRLPNGWFLSPAGKQIDVGDGPFNMDIDPSGSYAIVTNNGASDESISLVDLHSASVKQTIVLPSAWVGLKFYDGGKKFLASGGTGNRVYYFTVNDGKMALVDSIVFAEPWSDTTKVWIGGLDIDEEHGRVYVCAKISHELYVCDLATKAVIKKIDLKDRPYTCLLSKSKEMLYVSVWTDSAVAMIDTRTLEIAGTVQVGHNPNDMVESRDGKRLFVSNGSENTVSVIDVEKKTVIETISSALFPNAPPGSTPNSVALSADGNTLYIANADNNCIAVMDIAKPGQSRSLGFIPTGWYPSVVRIAPNSNDIVVVNVKGRASAANPGGPVPGKHTPHDQYIGSMLLGTVSIIPQPTAEQLSAFSAAVYANTPLKNVTGNLITPPEGNPIPAKPGDPSPVKHIFYVLKENRTYDQVFGDIKEGNGDPNLALFGQDVTPNLHAIVRQFVLLDNFYEDGEVSADGHNWCMAAYAPDYVEKSWPPQYGGHGGDFEFNGQNKVAFPAHGFLWDNCKRNGVSFRDYGEWVDDQGKASDPQQTFDPSLVGRFDTKYRGWDLEYSDVDRYKEWEREFSEFEKNGNLPQFEIVYFPNDHTSGTSKGALTPKAYVAQNDQAVGMLIERISHSRYWKESAIFIIEDDAQNGPDHIDAHRCEALVISPYTKHHFVDSRPYSTSSMVRTMELISGLPPMSQYDAAAEPMLNAFTADPDTAPYIHVPPSIDIEARNVAGAYGQERSGQLDFTSPDAAFDLELNDIIWRSVRGAASVPPPPIHSAFVRIQQDDDD